MFLTEEGLDILMGIFGQSHFDEDDAIGYLSAFCCMSSAPKNYEGGRLHILEFQGYIPLDQPAIVYFPGLIRHGGTPLMAPHSVPVDPRATRHAVVLYPPNRIMEGRVIHTLGTFPDGTHLRLPPEVTDWRYSNYRIPSTSHMNYHADAQVLLSDFALLNQCAHFYLLFILFLLRQLPRRFKPRVDTSMFLRSISMENSDGQRICCNEWPLGPDGSPLFDGADVTPPQPNPTNEPSDTSSSDSTDFTTPWDADMPGMSGHISLSAIPATNNVGEASSITSQPSSTHLRENALRAYISFKQSVGKLFPLTNYKCHTDEGPEGEVVASDNEFRASVYFLLIRLF